MRLKHCSLEVLKELRIELLSDIKEMSALRHMRANQHESFQSDATSYYDKTMKKKGDDNFVDLDEFATLYFFI